MRAAALAALIVAVAVLQPWLGLLASLVLMWRLRREWWRA